MEFQEKFKEDKFIAEMITAIATSNFNSGSYLLVGGAVIDLMEGRVPKDYDVIDESGEFHKILKSLDYTYKYDTTTSTTYQKGNTIVQILKADIAVFDYTISQASLDLSNLGLEYDKTSFDNKVLIPTHHALKDCLGAFASLHRRVHWRNKGYNLPDETYSSLLSVALRGNKLKTSS